MFSGQILQVETMDMMGVGAFLINLILLIFAWIKLRNESKHRVKEEIKEAKSDMKEHIHEQICAVKDKMETYEMKNTESHATMKADLTMSEQRMTNDYTRGFDRLEKFMEVQFKELREDIRNIKK